MGKYVCSCYSVKESEINDIINKEGITKYKELKKHTKAGSKDCCKKKLKALIKSHN